MLTHIKNLSLAHYYENYSWIQYETRLCVHLKAAFSDFVIPHQGIAYYECMNIFFFCLV